MRPVLVLCMCLPALSVGVMDAGSVATRGRAGLLVAGFSVSGTSARQFCACSILVLGSDFTTSQVVHIK
jgi:hypothetical protein